MHLQHNFLVVRWPDTRFAALRKGTVLRVAGCDGNAQESLGTDSRDAMARSLDASLLERWESGQDKSSIESAEIIFVVDIEPSGTNTTARRKE